MPDYEIGFESERETVLGAYRAIDSYFKSEDSFIEETCRAAANLQSSDFAKFESLTDSFNEDTLARRKYYDFVSLFNSFPEEKSDQRSFESVRVYEFIPKAHLKANQLPGFNKEGKPTFERSLLDFDNPVFMAHFGADLKEELVARKKHQQAKMYDATLQVLGRAIDLWLEHEPQISGLEEQNRKLWSEVWNTKDREEQEKRREAIEPFEADLKFHKRIKDECETFIINALESVLSEEDLWYHIQRLTQEQKTALIDFAIRDEKKALLAMMRPERYERLCDYNNVLMTQIDRVIAGDNNLTPDMQLVSNNYGYQPARTSADLSSFVRKNEGMKYSRENKRYAWHMHLFDTMQYLATTPQIDVRDLLVTLTHINEQGETSNGADSREIIYARHKNYIKLVTQSQLIPLVSAAINNHRNYKDLSFDRLVETVDVLAEFHRQMVNLVKDESNGYDHKSKLVVAPEHQEFLDLLERNINHLIRKAEHQAMSRDNALAKVTQLYRLYTVNGSSYNREDSRAPHVDKLDKKEGRLKAIEKQSHETSFWPDDVLEHAKAFAFGRKTFVDNKDFENQLLESILDKLFVLPSGKEKTECLHILLDKNLRAPYPETRQRLFYIYVQDVVARIGRDDKGRKYQRKLAALIKGLEDGPKKEWDVGKAWQGNEGVLSNSIALADKYLILRQLADTIVSQEKSSQMLKEKCQISLNSDDMMRSYLYGVGVDALTEMMDRDADMANNFVRFLNSKGERKDCDDISSTIEKSARKQFSRYKSHLDGILRSTRPSNCKILYENFWSAPLEARAVIIARMLKSVVSDERAETDKGQTWERVFDVVMDNIIPPDDHSIEEKYAREIMHSYIKSRSEYERVLILSAMMVANRNIGADIGNVGKALKLFLENMGPAEIKLGQAIASHPDTPEAIRKELQHLKNSADMPARWTIYDWIRAENVPEELWKEKHLGEIMGSASYYTSIALGEEEVLRILRPEAREKAMKGFRVIGLTVDDLRKKEGASDLSYGELTHSVQEMVTQAGRMSEIETDHDLGQQQYETAKYLCDDVTLTSGSETFTLKVMDWRAKGKNWIVMDRAKGLTYNALPEETPEQIIYKRHFARAYILFEMTNILSGGRFDHDRHGAQLSVDVATNKAGLYDTGAMALLDPSPKEQRLLGSVLYKVLHAEMRGEDIVSTFGRVTNEQIEELHRNGHDTQYLVEVKKGVLALGDFFKILDREDVQSILPSINISADLSKEVQAGITAQMSFFEKAQWQAFLAMQSARENSSVTIVRRDGTVNHVIKVDAISVQPSNQNKAGWLQNVFGEGGNGKSSPESSSFVHPSSDAKGYEALNYSCALG
ncbi:MAG: hypothetical protein PHX61_01910 [Alphaproteobacteria bacterium]|nr:hypothetical protein [Alphaproteobacteria bacterium]